MVGQVARTGRIFGREKALRASGSANNTSLLRRKPSTRTAQVTGINNSNNSGRISRFMSSLSNKIPRSSNFSLWQKITFVPALLKYLTAGILLVGGFFGKIITELYEALSSWGPFKRGVYNDPANSESVDARSQNLIRLGQLDIAGASHTKNLAMWSIAGAVATGMFLYLGAWPAILGSGLLYLLLNNMIGKEELVEVPTRLASGYDSSPASNTPASMPETQPQQPISQPQQQEQQDENKIPSRPMGGAVSPPQSMPFVGQTQPASLTNGVPCGTYGYSPNLPPWQPVQIYITNTGATGGTGGHVANG